MTDNVDVDLEEMPLPPMRRYAAAVAGGGRAALTMQRLAAIGGVRHQARQGTRCLYITIKVNGGLGTPVKVPPHVCNSLLCVCVCAPSRLGQGLRCPDSISDVSPWQELGPSSYRHFTLSCHFPGKYEIIGAKFRVYIFIYVRFVGPQKWGLYAFPPTFFYV